MNKFKIILIFFIGLMVNSGICDHISENSPAPPHCEDFKPQNILNIQAIQGLWYGSEILAHHHSEIGLGQRDACVTIHISEITHEMSTTRPRQPDSNDDRYIGQTTYYGYDNQRLNRPQYYHYLKVVLDAASTVDQTITEYTLRYNTSYPGYWISSPQKGTMLSLNYNQFPGTIQVMKAIGDHMVLTFCHIFQGSQLFSLVVTRKPNSLTADDLQSIHSLLQRRKLKTISARKVCNGTTSSATISIATLIGTAVLAFMFKM